MKATQLICLLAIGFALTFTTGCRKNHTKLTNIPGRTGGGVADGSDVLKPIGNTENPDANGLRPLGDKIGSLENYNQDRTTLATHIVHFDFDSAEVKASEKPHVEAVATHMKSSSNPLLIEGHCDERGTEEYNRALGERRALALRSALIELGVPGDMMTTLTFGEDKPVATGQDEAAYRQNRRGEFIILLPK